MKTAGVNLSTINVSGIFNPQFPVNHVAVIVDAGAGTAPTTIQQAIDRIAAVVKVLNSGTGA